MIRSFFKSRGKKYQLPVFFPDATRAVIRTLDSRDIEETKTQGILVNTLHLYMTPGEEVIKKAGGVRNFMKWKGAIISDSGGFQVGSLIKKNPNMGHVSDRGASFRMENGTKVFLTPEESIRFQMNLGVDMVVCLDDFDAPDGSSSERKVSTIRTIEWAKRSKVEFLKICKEKKLSESNRPYILGVVQGGRSKKLRKYCTEELIKIGFDGLGYGGQEKIGGITVDYRLAKYIAGLMPKDYFVYALGVGKPEDIVSLTKVGYTIFDCVLPTRDARHKRLYVFSASSINKIDHTRKKFYENFVPDKKIYAQDFSPVSTACDCQLCTNYTRAYLYHLFKIGDMSAMRLASIHNLRFYSLLMEKIRQDQKAS